MSSKSALYPEYSANLPRLQTDLLFTDYSNIYKYNGLIDKTMHFIEDVQLKSTEHWLRFVRQFREYADYDAGWRGEYWGKMMRGACFVYSYTGSGELYNELKKTVLDMIESADASGRISSYSVSHEFDGWDIWSRKYVLLGMQYFMEICTEDKLNQKIKASMCRQADYIISKIGSGDGKTEITAATRHWRGLNSSSLLEPIVRLYSITKEKRYLDFAEYIVNCGGTDVVNIFELAYEDELYPYQYPVTKAYEMTSCFEGLLEYYRVTKIEWYKQAVIRFADKILESDFTVIGCCGCTHELFDHSAVRQANTTNGTIMQETCVTVTLMKFFYQLNLLTADSKYADAFEISLYNAYLGSINTENVISPVLKRDFPECVPEVLPFDSYSPLTAGTRGCGIGGIKKMSDNHIYGCCVCIGPLGIGLVPKLHLLSSKDGLTMNLYIDGTVQAKTPLGNKITIKTKTAYPQDGFAEIKFELDADEEFDFSLRIPYWSKKTSLILNDSEFNPPSGYYSIRRIWKNGDTVKLSFDMRTKAIYPIPYGEQVLMNKVIWGHNYIIPTYDREDSLAKKHIALQRGPLMLAQENRLGYSVDKPISVKIDDDGYVAAVHLEKSDKSIPFDHIVGMDIPLSDGSYMTVTDYASAGKLWNEESKLAVWMLTE